MVEQTLLNSENDLDQQLKAEGKHEEAQAWDNLVKVLASEKQPDH